MNYSPVMDASIFLPDLRERRERAYRAFIGVVDSWILAHDVDRDADADLLALAEQEIIGEAMRQIYRVMTGGPERTHRMAYLQKVPAPSKLWKQSARFGLSLLGLRTNYRPPILFRPDRDICAFHRSALTVAYAEQKNVDPCLMTHGDWFGRATAAVNRGSSFSAEVEHMLVTAMRNAFKAAELNDEIVIEQSVSRFSEYARWIDFHRTALSNSARRLPKMFWAGTMGFPLHRIFARAVMRLGGEVVGFDHGSGSGMHDWDFQVRTEFGMVNRFVTFSTSMAEGLRRNTERCGRRFSNVKIEALSAPRKEKITSFDSKSNIKILYVSRSNSGENFISPPLDTSNFLRDWQWRVLGALKTTGMEVGFKPHPEDTNTHVTHFRDALGVEIHTGKLEEFDWTNTVFVFDTTLSSTFPYALATGLPIILFDTPHVAVSPEARKMLVQRVAMAPVWRDPEGRLQADLTYMPELFESAVSKRGNNSVLQNYYGVETSL